MLTKVIECIEFLEKRNKALYEENNPYKDQIKAYGTLIPANEKSSTSTTTTETSSPISDTSTSTAGSSPLTGSGFDTQIAVLLV